jgi:hypothetical protein
MDFRQTTQLLAMLLQQLPPQFEQASAPSMRHWVFAALNESTSLSLQDKNRISDALTRALALPHNELRQNWGAPDYLSPASPLLSASHYLLDSFIDVLDQKTITAISTRDTGA